ncbi:uncharacterized protein LOC116176167 [Photinus pyralis]|uniref:uncharacterized protein LOC116165301 n=1 Tax=Photinus pyralis TaxID=7054 RepID=UPI0012671FA4|nr:uncharacterized protein LOC116165301 [Photinus pyralis]XP_031350505.1 uncharacterized protein LOC116176167 [Photinus pyralis]
MDNSLEDDDTLVEVKFLINNEIVTFSDSGVVATALKTDANFVLEYISRAIEEGFLEQFGVCKGTSIADIDISRISDETPETIETAVAAAETDQEIWSSRGKPTDLDRRATEYMLELRNSAKFQTLFADKKTVKMSIWGKIAELLGSAGFPLNPKEGGKKCYQKFQNLTKMYINFIKHVKTTGGEAREPPPHYDLLHNILGDKHKITLGHIKDSLQLADTQDELNVIHQPQPCATTSQQPLTPTSSSSRSQTPTSSSHLLESSTPLSRSHTYTTPRFSFPKYT